MTWLLHLLSVSPQAQQRCVDEQADIFDSGADDYGRPPTADDLARMRYLECCVKEALRLFPSVPMYGRTLGKAIETSGCFFWFCLVNH